MYDAILTTALTALRKGQTLLYPTDTIWGIGCDASDADAVERIYSIKQRDHSKAMLVLALPEMISPQIPEEALHLLLHSSRPTTVILPTELLSVPLAHNLPATDKTVGVRIPQFDFCQQLIQRLGSPIVSTSANLSGTSSPGCYEEINPLLMKRVDCCLPDHPSFHHAPTGSSRIVKVMLNGSLSTLRD